MNIKEINQDLINETLEKIKNLKSEIKKLLGEEDKHKKKADAIRKKVGMRIEDAGLLSEADDHEKKADIIHKKIKTQQEILVENKELLNELKGKLANEGNAKCQTPSKLNSSLNCKNKISVTLKRRKDHGKTKKNS